MNVPKRYERSAFGTASRTHTAMLAAPGIGFVLGSECRNRTIARMLLEDRFANGQAFEGEIVVRVPNRVSYEYWFRWCNLHFGWDVRDAAAKLEGNEW